MRVITEWLLLLGSTSAFLTTSGPINGRVNICRGEEGSGGGRGCRSTAPKARVTIELWLELLKTYREQHGTCIVPQPYVTPGDGYRLGYWVSNARRKYKEGRMRPELVEALEELGMAWDVKQAQWSEGYRELEVYRQCEGHCLVPQDYETEGSSYCLGSWVSHQRRRYKAGKMPEEQSELLDELGMIWDVEEYEWEEGFEALMKYRRVNGDDALVAPNHVTPQGFRLGQWVERQTWNVPMSRGLLSEEQRKELESMRMTWEEGLKHATAYSEQHGDCLVPLNYTAPPLLPTTVAAEGAFALGQWIASQRRTYKGGGLTWEQLNALEGLGMIWDPAEAKTEEGIRELKAFKREHGHCLVPGKFTMPDGFKLGAWVLMCREKKKAGGIELEEQLRLEELGMVWDPMDAKFDEGMTQMFMFQRMHGHCFVATRYVTSNGYKLGQWVTRQRLKRRQGRGLSPAQMNSLDELGMVWDAEVARWEQGYYHLKRYRVQHGNCLVPQRYTVRDASLPREDKEYQLGKWVDRQRKKKQGLMGGMSEERSAKLGELGMVWDVDEARFREGLVKLRKYRRINGHCRVPDKHEVPCPNGGPSFKLGRWVARQRAKHREAKRRGLALERNGSGLDVGRIEDLDALDFVWEVRRSPTPG